MQNGEFTAVLSFNYCFGVLLFHKSIIMSASQL